MIAGAENSNNNNYSFGASEGSPGSSTPANNGAAPPGYGVVPPGNGTPPGGASPPGPPPLSASTAIETQAEILSFVSKQKSKSAFFRELIRHLIFVAIFLLVMFLQRNVFESYLMNHALVTAFVDQNIDHGYSPFPKTFKDVGEWEEARDV